MQNQCPKLPNFLIVGAQRSGSTYLWGLLRQHPQIFMPAQKEPQFFQSRRIDHQYPLANYERHYLGVQDELAIGDAAVENMFIPGIEQLIAEVLGDVKLIFLLRNPVPRAYSHYWMMVSTRREFLSFEAALRVEKFRMRRSFLNYRNYSYRARGKYFDQIKRFFPYFHRKKMMFILSSDLYDNPQDTLEKVTQFLGVDGTDGIRLDVNKHGLPIPRKHHQFRWLNFIRLAMKERPGYWRISPRIRSWQDKMLLNPIKRPPINPGTYWLLEEFFKKENDQLSENLGVDLSHWYRK